MKTGVKMAGLEIQRREYPYRKRISRSYSRSICCLKEFRGKKSYREICNGPGDDAKLNGNTVDVIDCNIS